MKLSFDLSISGSGKSWFALCEMPGAQGTVSGQGTASSKDVAASRALQNCIKALEDHDEPDEPIAPPPSAPPEPQGDPRVGRRYKILKGRREGETCTFLRHVGTREDSSENWDVKFDDGTIGIENSRYVMAVK